MSNGPLLSIIVPVYNVEKYLRRCLDSILAQTFTNIEVIAVNDGSPDNCGKILDEYAQKDKRIKVIHKENGGVSSARNTGLDMATGTYIGFVDPDDTILPDMYEYLYTQIIENRCDIVQCNFLIVDLEGNEKRFLDHIKDREIVNKFEINKAFLNNEIRYNLCNKLFRREVLRDVYFRKELRIAEDKLFVNECINNAEKVKICSKYCYYYFLSETSVMHSGITEKKFDDIIVLDILHERYKDCSELSEYFNVHASTVILDVFLSVLSSGNFKEKVPELIKRTLTLKGTIINGNFPKYQKIFVRLLSFAPKTMCKLAEIYFTRKN